MVKMLLNQQLLGCHNRLLDCVQLLSDVGALTPCHHHFDDVLEVTIRTFEAFDQSRVG